MNITPTQEEVEGALAAVLAAALAGNDPDRLEAEAEDLRARAWEAAQVPGRLALEAAEKSARALILRARELAVAEVQAASEEVARCEAAYEALEEPERIAAGQAFEALQDLQRAHYDKRKALDGRAGKDEITRLNREIVIAQETVDDLEPLAVEATREREAADADLEAARAARRSARAALQEVEESLAAPMAAEIPDEEMFRVLERCWTDRVEEALAPGGRPLSQAELTACQVHARKYANVLGVGAEQVAALAAAQARAEVQAAVAGQLNRTTFVDGSGREVNLGQAVGIPPGMAGR